MFTSISSLQQNLSTTIDDTTVNYTRVDLSVLGKGLFSLN